jgi:sugar (pentulose or hexulose) kinase
VSSGPTLPPGRPKAVLVELAGADLAVALARVQVSSPCTGWAGSDPEEQWPSVNTAGRHIMAGPNTRVRAVGFHGRCPVQCYCDLTGAPCARPFSRWPVAP